MKELKVSAIKDGTVIDHIPGEAAFEVAEILKLNKETKDIVSIATNLSSKKLKSKGIIKIGGRNLNKEETDKIALIAPNATINIIKDYRVIEKHRVKVPKEFNAVVKCFNPNCITNVQNIGTKFYVLAQEPIKIRCHYCERVMKREDIVLL